MTNKTTTAQDGVIPKSTMREFDALCLTPVEKLTPEEIKAIRLSARDFALFMAAVNHPKPPNARLEAAAENYKTVRREQPELNW